MLRHCQEKHIAVEYFHRHGRLNDATEGLSLDLLPPVRRRGGFKIGEVADRYEVVALLLLSWQPQTSVSVRACVSHTIPGTQQGVWEATKSAHNTYECP